MERKGVGMLRPLFMRQLTILLGIFTVSVFRTMEEPFWVSTLIFLYARRWLRALRSKHLLELTN